MKRISTVEYSSERLEEQPAFREELKKSIIGALHLYIQLWKSDPWRMPRQDFIRILESNFRDISLTIVNSIFSVNCNLTKKEFIIADMIRKGKSTKEIANHLNLSVNGVLFHRNNIRKKLGLIHKKMNLRSHLLLPIGEPCKKQAPEIQNMEKRWAEDS